MATPTPDPQTSIRVFKIPHAFPTLEREAGDLIWVATGKATPEELRLHLSYRLAKLWRELDDIREIATFMLCRYNVIPRLPAFVANPGALPPWVDRISEDDYKALDREWNCETNEDDEEGEA